MTDEPKSHRLERIPAKTYRVPAKLMEHFPCGEPLEPRLKGDFAGTLRCRKHGTVATFFDLRPNPQFPLGWFDLEAGL